MTSLYAGSICGTSLDGIDVAIVELAQQRARVLHYASTPLPTDVSRSLSAIVFDGKPCDARTLGTLDQQLGIAIATAINDLIHRHSLSPEDITAIGSHGVNLLHGPFDTPPFTLQIGDPNQIAAITGIVTVADFRRRDIALGGQGAPLAPAFHAAVFGHATETRVVLNLGGIANITVLAPGQPVIGYDTGPANGLLDAWFKLHGPNSAATYDDDGTWAAGGDVHRPLLDALLQEPYFSQSAPKSTGKELFNLDWLHRQLTPFDELSARDVQATLAQLTATSVSQSIRRDAPDLKTLLVCGGGAHNGHLMSCLQQQLPHADVTTTAPIGVHPDQVEAAAFAWLAKRTLAQQPGNLPSVTGAQRESVLGGVYFP